MYRTVRELRQSELEELKETIFWEHPEVSKDWMPWEIPNEVVYRFFDGISFVEEDFWCNI